VQFPGFVDRKCFVLGFDPRINVDCCDMNADVFPGQTKYFKVPIAECGGFDYDCDGQDEPQYTLTCIEPPCSAGWLQTFPDCGQTGSYCLNCSGCGSCIGSSIQQKQRCR